MSPTRARCACTSTRPTPSGTSSAFARRSPSSGAGRMTLLFPRWLPGTHAPTGRIEQLAGLTIRAGATRLDWTRDALDGFAFHVTVPNATPALEIEFQVLTAVDASQGRIVITDEMLNLQWNAVALYPAGYYASRIPVEASVRLPEGWQFGVALETASSAGGVTTFKPVPFDQLVDSPMFAGRYFKRFELGRTGNAPVYLERRRRRPELLEAKPEHIEAHRSLVDQAHKLFGAYHYDHYDFLLALTDRMGGIGLEHHQSSENGTAPTYFTEWDKNADTRGPAAARVRAFLERQVPAAGRSLDARTSTCRCATPALGLRRPDAVLGLRAGRPLGLFTKQQALDSHRLHGRGLRSPARPRMAAARRTPPTIRSSPCAAPIPWRSWQRSEDYYSEAPADLARRRHADPRALERAEVARRFRARLLRHQQRQLRAGDVHFRGHRPDAERGAAARLDEVPAHAAGLGRRGRAARRPRARRLQARLYGYADELLPRFGNAPARDRSHLLARHQHRTRQQAHRRAVGRPGVQGGLDGRHRADRGQRHRPTAPTASRTRSRRRGRHRNRSS